LFWGVKRHKKDEKTPDVIILQIYLNDRKC
jgi:hypothetical protein